MRAELERFIAGHRTRLERVEVGTPATDARLKKAERALGRLPRELVELYREVDGFALHWRNGEGETGLASLHALATVPAEDQLWNDQYDEQAEPDSVPLARLRRMRVLWAFPGVSLAVGLALTARAARLFCGEPNLVRPLELKLSEFALACLKPPHKLIEELRTPPRDRRESR